jgi:16S rRNA (guanine527-N7)-methyltransferase
LLEWNSKFNLTRITDPTEIVIKHFLDSLSCLAAADFPLDAKVIDVGTGAGFPGIPIEIVRPDLNITLLDSTRKRLAFLESVAVELELGGILLAHGRAEDAGQDIERREFYDIAVARAVARMNALAEYMLPLVRLGGFAIAQKGPDIADELKEAEPGITLLGGEVEKVGRATLPYSDITRTIIVIRKVLNTPPAYPRKPAAIHKQPL